MTGKIIQAVGRISRILPIWMFRIAISSAEREEHLLKAVTSHKISLWNQLSCRWFLSLQLLRWSLDPKLGRKRRKLGLPGLFYSLFLPPLVLLFISHFRQQIIKPQTQQLRTIIWKCYWSPAMLQWYTKLLKWYHGEADTESGGGASISKCGHDWGQAIFFFQLPNVSACTLNCSSDFTNAHRTQAMVFGGGGGTTWVFSLAVAHCKAGRKNSDGRLS